MNDKYHDTKQGENKVVEKKKCGGFETTWTRGRRNQWQILIEKYNKEKQKKKWKGTWMKEHGNKMDRSKK